jgi:ABC-type Fe3+/spermidine/putrescine transport system ATPase subunit
VEVALDVDPGETLVLLGPSGSGKSLLLETVAGFHPHDGRVALDGRALTGVAPEERGFGFVFQDHALLPHCSVRENVAFGQRYRDGDLPDPGDLLAALGVGHLADRSPATLSGGEAQRVALARALAVAPGALLLDEPLAALDVPTRESLRADLADAVADVTALYVTHDRTTARALADRVAVLRAGRVVQVGDVESVFERPASAFVAEFTGANRLPGRVAGLPDVGTVAIRPEHVVLAAGVDAEVVRAVREDAATRVVLSGDDYTATAYAADPPAVGSTVDVSFPAEHCVPLSVDG